MGAKIKIESNTAMITGVRKLKGAQVESPDLRAGAALTIAGLAAEGCTQVSGIQFIQRGYENFEDKLRRRGADICKIDTDDEAAMDDYRQRCS